MNWFELWLSQWFLCSFFRCSLKNTILFRLKRHSNFMSFIGMKIIFEAFYHPELSFVTSIKNQTCDPYDLVPWCFFLFTSCHGRDDTEPQGPPRFIQNYPVAVYDLFPDCVKQKILYMFLLFLEHSIFFLLFEGIMHWFSIWFLFHRIMIKFCC